MDQRERKRILGEGGVRAPNAREAREGRQLERDLAGSPVLGEPLRFRQRNFRPSVEGYVVSLGGPLPYMQRLTEIDRLTEALHARLEKDWRQLADHVVGDQAAFRRRWLLQVERYGYQELNELVERHNLFFPAESRLPMDVRRRDYALINGKSYRRPRVGPSWALALFPAELEAASRG